MENIQPKDLDQSKPGWYFALMARNVKEGPHWPWLDPSRLYIFKEAFEACVEDMVAPFQSEASNIDLVAGIDAMGFITGAAVATRLGKGFLALRKHPHLCVDVETVPYTDYMQREKVMEIRKDAFKPGIRVLLVDQWIETGGTMEAAVTLVERLGGVVAGICTIAMQNQEKGLRLKDKYRLIDLTPKHLLERIDAHDDNYWLECIEYFRK